MWFGGNEDRDADFYFFRFVSLLWHVFSPFLIQLYNEILTLQLDQFLGSRSSGTAPIYGTTFNVKVCTYYLMQDSFYCIVSS